MSLVHHRLPCASLQRGSGPSFTTRDHSHAWLYLPASRTLLAPHQASSLSHPRTLLRTQVLDAVSNTRQAHTAEGQSVHRRVKCNSDAGRLACRSKPGCCPPYWPLYCTVPVYCTVGVRYLCEAIHTGAGPTTEGAACYELTHSYRRYPLVVSAGLPLGSEHAHVNAPRHPGLPSPCFTFAGYATPQRQSRY